LWRQQSHHCGIETKLAPADGDNGRSSNRTIVGLKGNQIQ